MNRKWKYGIGGVILLLAVGAAAYSLLAHQEEGGPAHDPDAPGPHAVLSWSDNTEDGRVERNGKYEALFSTDAVYSNYDDPDIVEVNAHVSDPNGNMVLIPAFWYVGYKRTLEGTKEKLVPDGIEGWKIRYTPRMAGTYTYYLEIADKVAHQNIRYPAGQETLAFTSLAADHRGFLQPSTADPAYLEYDDGSFFLGIGHNLAGWEWDGRTAIGTGDDNRGGTYDYDRWMTSLSEQGGNLTQLDFAEGDQLEWTYQEGELPYSQDWNGLTRMNPQTAWKMDYRFAKAEELGLYFRVTLSHWEDFDTETGNFPDWGWNRNPYNVKNGGPADQVETFFTDREAIRDYKKYLRYVIARYGYSPNVLAWELWNELDLALPYTNAAETKVLAWHEEMSKYLKQIDPNRHMVTTSFAETTRGGSVWELDDIDFTTFHRYTLYNEDFPAEGFRKFETEPVLAHLIQGRLDTYGKPVIAGEFALSPGGDIQRDRDPDGLAFHNQLWASIMAKSFGTAMHWTWGSYLDKNDLYFHYKALSTVFDGADLRGFQPFVSRSAEAGKGLELSFNTADEWEIAAPAANQFTAAPNDSFIKSSGHSLQVDFDLAADKQGGWMSRDLSAVLRSADTDGIDQLSFWAYNPKNNPDAELRIKLTDADGHEYECRDSYPLDWTGWRRIDVPLSRMAVVTSGKEAGSDILRAQALTRIQLGIVPTEGRSAGSGTIYIDMLAFSESIHVSGLKSDRAAYVWIRDVHSNFLDYQDETLYPMRVFSGASLTLTDLADGNYSLTYYDTRSANVVASVTEQSKDGVLATSMPDFSQDLALKAVKLD